MLLGGMHLSPCAKQIPQHSSAQCRPARRRLAAHPFAVLDSGLPGCRLCQHSSSPIHRGLRSPVLPIRRRKEEAPQEVRRQADTGQIEGASNRRPPNILIRVLSAAFFMIPWMDIFGLSAIYDTFPHSLIILLIGKPFVSLYFQSQWTPLVLFFLMYLYVIRNNKLHHFMRFYCMQAIMVDIITMLFTLVRNYFPAEVRWSPLQDVFDIFTFSMVMFTILYCQFFALRGRYADVPFVTDAVCMQVEPSV